MFSEMYDFLTYGTPMGPASSWMFIIFLFGGTAILVLGIREFDTFAQLAAYNVKSSGARGIWYAFRGIETYSIREEHVVDVVDCDKIGGFRAETYDGEDKWTYYVLPTFTDEEDEDYNIAIDLSDGDEDLKNRLLPPSRVKGHFSIRKGENATEFLVMYLRYRNTKEVEDTLKIYFKNQYNKEIAEARAARLGRKTIA